MTLDSASAPAIESAADGGGGHVIISPFANERVREWPLGHFCRLIRLIVHDRTKRVIIVGTRAQRVRANELVRDFSALKVLNTCGQLKWSEVSGLVDTACTVIGINSSIVHVAAKHARWTLCIFAGSHAWSEWMPRGPRVVLITRMTKCSPCELGGELCPNDIICMNDLTPEAVYARFLEIQARIAEEEETAAEFAEQVPEPDNPWMIRA